MSLEKRLKLYIMENFLFTDDESEISSNDSFSEKGILDSTGILEVITYIEEAAGIAVDEDDMVPDNFDSISKIVNYVNSRK